MPEMTGRRRSRKCKGMLGVVLGAIDAGVSWQGESSTTTVLLISSVVLKAWAIEQKHRVHCVNATTMKNLNLLHSQSYVRIVGLGINIHVFCINKLLKIKSTIVQLQFLYGGLNFPYSTQFYYTEKSEFMHFTR